VLYKNTHSIEIKNEANMMSEYEKQMMINKLEAQKDKERHLHNIIRTGKISEDDYMDASYEMRCVSISEQLHGPNYARCDKERIRLNRVPLYEKIVSMYESKH